MKNEVCEVVKGNNGAIKKEDRASKPQSSDTEQQNLM